MSVADFVAEIRRFNLGLNAGENIPQVRVNDIYSIQFVMETRRWCKAKYKTELKYCTIYSENLS